MALSVVAIKAAKGREKPYKLTDGDGLFLYVTPSGGRYWRMNYRYLGKQKTLAFGVWPDTGLADAREQRDTARKLLARGEDPGERIKLDRIAATVAASNSFKAVADEWLIKVEREDRSATTMKKLRWLLAFINASIGKRPIASISAQELLVMLRKMEGKGRYETAKRLRSTCSQITTQANAAAGAVALASNVAYRPFGPVTAATLGNGVQLTDSYDLDYRLTGRQAVGSATVQNLTLSYDSASNIASIADGLTSGLSQTYQYDLVGRVTQGTGVWGTDNYTYDAVGNRLTRSLVNGSTTTTTYTYATANAQLTKAVTGSSTLNYAYAADGSLLTRKLGNTTQASYTYNADGRMSASGSAALKYNAFGERSVETITGGGTHFLFSPDGLLLAEHTTAGAVVHNYVYLNGQPLAIIDAAGAISYVLNDQIGQPQKMLNLGGTVSWQRNSGIFGDTVSQPVGTTAANPLRFPGQQFDPNLALHYNYFRDYDPATGRYLETDPIGLKGGPNLYAYVDGNPVALVDPFGLETIWEHYTGLPDSYRVNAMNVIAGASDVMTLGATNKIRDWLGINDEIDQCTPAYKTGEAAGIGASILAGGAAGIRAAGTRGAGKEFSHWIPNRMGGPRSLGNGNYVSTAEHALSDPYRYRFMPRTWKEANPLPNRGTQQWNRIPKVYKGAGAGAAVGAAGAANSECGCE